MNEVAGRKGSYAAWQKAVLIGCLVVAILGTLFVIGMMLKVSGTITEYGGNLNAAFFVVLFYLLFSTWLFAGLGALLVYVAKTNRDVADLVRASGKLEA
jgi:heme/copper-type cytochrome/quinol oxidase subunit 3